VVDLLDLVRRAVLAAEPAGGVGEGVVGAERRVVALPDDAEVRGGPDLPPAAGVGLPGGVGELVEKDELAGAEPGGAGDVDGVSALDRVGGQVGGGASAVVPAGGADDDDGGRVRSGNVGTGLRSVRLLQGGLSRSGAPEGDALVEQDVTSGAADGESSR
jgi:hypothetical protein